MTNHHLDYQRLGVEANLTGFKTPEMIPHRYRKTFNKGLHTYKADSINENARHYIYTELKKIGKTQ